MADKAKRAALIGYDCLIPKRLEAMLAQGGLENFRKFMAEGSFIPPKGYNPAPPVTPRRLGATICTGALSPARTAWRTITITMKAAARLQGNHAAFAPTS